MANLNEIVRQSVLEYAGGGPNLRTFPVWNEEQQVYSVLSVESPQPGEAAAIVVMARLEGDSVIVEEDTTTRPLYEVLLKRGIPREKIILRYVHEEAPR
jgi:hypothetical protein